MRRPFLVLYIVGLLGLTLAPLPETANQLASVQGFDKAVHLVLFGGLAVLWYWNLHDSARQPAMLQVVAPCAVLAALIEVLQAPLPYRTADVWDFFWGLIGALVAYLAIRRMVSRAS